MAGAAILERFSSVSRFHIPTFICELCPARMNPSYDAEKIDEWCFQFLGLKSSDLKRQLVDWKLGLFSALCYPDLPPKGFDLAAKFGAWLFLADDVLDNPEVGPSDVKNITVAYIKIFNDEYEVAKSLIQSQEILRQMDMFHNLWEELRASMKKPARDRFVDALEESLQMFRVESAWIHHKILPNIETYMWMRRPASATVPCLVLVDALQPLDLEEAAHDPLIQKLEVIVLDHISLSNDIVSFRKEWVDGKYLNIVPLLAFYHDCSVDEGIVKAIRMVKELELEFVHVTAAINSNIELYNRKGVKEYVEGMGTWIKGNSDWGWITCRYHEQPHPESSGTFTLLHKGTA